MTRFVHRLTISIYSITILTLFIILGFNGFSFYILPIEERFFHPLYSLLKPSGILGHGLGIIGTLLIIIGVFSYMARKRAKRFSRIGSMKYWLEFHIFLCALGPVLILYHTSFKFGGIVSVSFWSLIAVVVSGIAGRFIYLQIPHSIEGRILSLQEVLDMKEEMITAFKNNYNIDISDLNSLNFKLFETKINTKNFAKGEYQKVKRLIINQRKLVRRIDRLDQMQNIFKYWHVAHLPFALITLIIMIVHVVVVLALGYKWIF